MVNYEKIIRRFLNLRLVFKWELFVSFRVQMVPPFLFRMLQYIPCIKLLCRLTVNPNNNAASKVCFFFKIFVQS